MTLKLKLIGNEIVVEGQVVATLEEGLSASMEQDLRDTLNGVELDGVFHDGTLQQLEDMKEEEEDQRTKRKRGLTWARARLSLARLTFSNTCKQVSQLMQERNQARQWAEQTVNETYAKLDVALRERNEARAYAESLLKVGA